MCLKLKVYDVFVVSDGIFVVLVMDVVSALDATDFLLRCYYGGCAFLVL